MAKRIFTSFHYIPDNWRASQIRSIGKIEGSSVATTNKWEEVTNGGDKAIENWINENMTGKSCVVVFVGHKTAGRKWIKYEIEKAWKDGRGLFGIYVHNLKDANGDQTDKGKNPFDEYSIGTEKLSSIIKCYDPPYTLSTNVYNHIAENIEDWIDKAIEIRNKY
jgi:hypothetical protein